MRRRRGRRRRRANKSWWRARAWEAARRNQIAQTRAEPRAHDESNARRSAGYRVGSFAGPFASRRTPEQHTAGAALVLLAQAPQRSRQIAHLADQTLELRQRLAGQTFDVAAHGVDGFAGAGAGTLGLVRHAFNGVGAAGDALYHRAELRGRPRAVVESARRARYAGVDGALARGDCVRDRGDIGQRAVERGGVF